MKYSHDLLSKVNEVANLNQINLEELVDFSATFVDEKLKFIKTHQIRRFFDAIKNIRIGIGEGSGFTERDRAKLIMLRPQLANAAGRQTNRKGREAMQSLEKVCSEMIKKVKEKDDFLQFVNFFESLVAFHKAKARE